MLKPEHYNLPTFSQFLHAPTPPAWLEHAIKHWPLLLIDHAHCERKAAATAINFLSKYPEKQELVAVMSPLAREELLHFEKVLVLLQERNITYSPLQPSDYAQQLHKEVTSRCHIARLCDQLIIGAIIEARSCERFQALAPLLDDKILGKFYATLAKAEARHFQDYLRLAYHYGGDMQQRISYFLDLECKLIHKEDQVFRFHSGIPLS